MSMAAFSFVIAVISFSVLLMLLLVGSLWRLNTVSEDYFDLYEDFLELEDEYNAYKEKVEYDLQQLQGSSG